MSENKGMQFGVFVRVFERPTLSERFAAVRDTGFSSTHFDFTVTEGDVLPASLDRAAVKEVYATASAAGLPISSVEGMYNMAHPSAEVRAEGHAGLSRVIEVARELGTDVVTVCSGSRGDGMWRWHSDNASPEAWRDMLSSMVAAVEVAERHAVVLSVEVEYKTVVATPEDGRRLLDEIRSPALKITMDAANLLPPGTTDNQRAIFQNAFELLGEDVVLAHAKDVLPDGEFVAAGLGVVDFRLFLGHLEECGFGGPVIFHGLDESQAAGCLEHLSAEDPHAQATGRAAGRGPADGHSAEGRVR